MKPALYDRLQLVSSGFMFTAFVSAGVGIFATFLEGRASGAPGFWIASFFAFVAWLQERAAAAKKGRTARESAAG
jgi:hypothetical protein